MFYPFCCWVLVNTKNTSHFPGKSINNVTNLWNFVISVKFKLNIFEPYLFNGVSLKDKFRIPFKMHLSGYKYKEIADALSVNIAFRKTFRNIDFITFCV